MYPANVELTDSDFEFAKPPISKNFILMVFEKYELDFMAYFGENMFYVSRQNFESLPPLYPNNRYPEDIELIFDFMVRERIRSIKYERGSLFRTTTPRPVDSNQ